MSTYYGTQTFHTTTNSYFLINVQFCFEMRTNPFTVDHNHEGVCELMHKIACSHKKARDTEYRCLDRFVSNVNERRISS